MSSPPLSKPSHPGDRQLLAMILLSAVVHALVVGVAVWLPKDWLKPSTPPLVSYTVDLIAPDKLGGNNIVTGGKGRVHAPPMVAAAPPAAEARKAAVEVPPPPKPESAKPLPPPPPPKPESAVPEPPPALAEKPEPPPKVEVQPEPKAAENPPEAKPPPPKPEPPKKEEAPAKADEMALSKAKPTAPIQVTPAKVAPTPKLTKAETPAAASGDKVEAKKAADAKKAAEVKKAADAKAAAEKAAADKAAAEKAAVEKAAAEKAVAEKAVAEKAAADKAAAEKASKEAAERDSQIAAAIRKVQQRGERGGGLTDKPGEQPGGPIAAGPGDGIGGQVMGVEALIYRNMVFKKIQDAWAWAGANQALVASVRFSITESGEIHDVKIDKSSGDRGFDASVERAVRAASPLPPPPEQYRSMFTDFLLDFDSRDLQM